MGRPPLPVGTWGDISVHATASGRHEARARYRDYDGVTRYARAMGGDTMDDEQAAAIVGMDLSIYDAA